MTLQAARVRKLLRSGSSCSPGKSAADMRKLQDWGKFCRPIVRKNSPKLFHSLYSSMPRRRLALIRGKGKAIKY